MSRLSRWWNSLMARIKSRRVTVTPRTDTGALDPRYPNGTPPPATPAITVAAPPTFTYAAGDAISQSLAAYVTGADSPPDSYAMVAVTGTLAGVGASLAGNTFSGTAVAGDFIYRLRAVEGAYTFDASATSLIHVDPVQSTDTLAPTIPAFMTLAVNTATPKITIAADYPMDNRSATINPTDPVKVDIYKSTDGGAYSLLTTKTAAGSQPSFSPTLTQIGGATAGSMVYSTAGTLTLSSISNGQQSNSIDSCNFAGALITFPVGARFICKVPTFSAGSAAIAGPMIRDSLTTLAPCVALWKRADEYGNTAANPFMSRATQGAALSYGADATIAAASYMCIERGASNTWILTQWADGVITSINTRTVAMGAQVYLGHFAAAEGGATFSVAFEQVAINTQGRFSHDDTSVLASHNYSYYLKGKDSVGTPNVSAASDAVSASVGSVPAGGYKWNPGIYAHAAIASTSNYLRTRLDQAEIYSQLSSFLTSEIAGTNFEGIMVEAGLRAFDNRTTSPTSSTDVNLADYADGFAWMDALLALCTTYNKRLIVVVKTRWDGGYPTGKETDLLPVYMVNDTTNYGLTHITNWDGSLASSFTARLWQTNTTNRLKAVSSAYGARYDGHAKLEGICFYNETAINVSGRDGYSGAGFHAQWLSFQAAAFTHWPTTQRFQWFNDTDPWTSANAAQYMTECLQYKITYSNPNTTTAGWTLSDLAMAGKDTTGASVYTNRIDALACIAHCDDNDFYATSTHGNPDGSVNGTPYQTLDQIWTNHHFGWTYGAIVQPSLHPSHIAWKYNGYAGNSSNQWSAQKAFLIAKKAAGLPSYGTPTMFGSVVTGG